MNKYPEISSQKLLFMTTGVTISTIGRIRLAEVFASIDYIDAIAKAFRITSAQMLDPKVATTLDKFASERCKGSCRLDRS